MNTCSTVSTDSRGRVIVGVDGSPESLSALRQAVAQARCRHAELLVLHVRSGRRAWIPSLRRVGDGVGLVRRPLHVRGTEAAGRGGQLIADCLHEATDGEPVGVPVGRFTPVGRPGKALLDLARRSDDLLVVGSRADRRRRPARRSVSRYCAKRARCPVLVVSAEPKTAPASPDNAFLCVD